jgi:hypothetical protein
MKRDRQTNATAEECTIPRCVECELCRVFNFGDKQIKRSEVDGEVKSLYGAEALTYYFYFMPVTNRA